jgi:hypothetical protein
LAPKFLLGAMGVPVGGSPYATIWELNEWFHVEKR